MKSLSVFLSAMFILASLALPALALESKVYTVYEKTLTVDLGPSFEISRGTFNVTDGGIASQSVFINDTTTGGSASIAIMSAYDDVLSKMSLSSISELFLIAGTTSAEAKGDREIGNWRAVSSQGKNVTVNTLSTKDEQVKMFGGRYDIAVWDLDRSTYAVMVSLFDENNTTKIIKTLAIS